MAAEIWAITSGKGGVGKTFFTSSLGITLAKLNQKVLIIDFDKTGANIHTHLGCKLSETNLRQFFYEEKPLSELILNTNIPKLFHVQGFWDAWGSPEPTFEATQRLIFEARNLNFDFVLFDLGTGVDSTYLNIFHAADERILLAQSEPTCIEKTYRFFENYICFSLTDSKIIQSVEEVQNDLREFRRKQNKGNFSFRDFLKEKYNLNGNIFNQYHRTPIRLVINSSRSRLDQDLGYSIKSVCIKYFDIEIDYLGYIDYDNAVWHSIKEKVQVLIAKPFTHLSGQFLTIARQLSSHNFQSNLFKEVI